MNRVPPPPVLAPRDLAGAGRGAERIDGNPALDRGPVMARPTDRPMPMTATRPTPRTLKQLGRALHVRSPSVQPGRTAEALAGAVSLIETSGLPRIVDTRLTMLAPKRAKKPDSSFLRRTKSSGRRSVTHGRRPRHRHRHRHRHRDSAPPAAIGARSRAHPDPTTPTRLRPRGRRSAAVAADGIVLVRDRVAQVRLPTAVAAAVVRTRVVPTTVRARRVGW